VELSKIIHQEEDLIRISSYVENKAYIAKIVEGFDDARLKRIISVAYQHDMQQEVLTVFTHQSDKEVKRILKIIQQLPDLLSDKVLKDFEKRMQ